MRPPHVLQPKPACLCSSHTSRPSTHLSPTSSSPLLQRQPGAGGAAAHSARGQAGGLPGAGERDYVAAARRGRGAGEWLARGRRGAAEQGTNERRGVPFLCCLCCAALHGRDARPSRACAEASFLSKWQCTCAWMAGFSMACAGCSLGPFYGPTYLLNLRPSQAPPCSVHDPVQAVYYRKLWNFPNNYAFTKRLAEHLLLDRHK